MNEFSRHPLGEPEVVLSSELAAILLEFKDRWDKERPPRERLVNSKEEQIKVFGNPSSRVGMPVMGPWKYLSVHSGVNGRAIWRIVTGESKYTNLSTADALMRAADYPHRFANGEITVIPNPRWSQEKYIAYMRERGCI